MIDVRELRIGNFIEWNKTLFSVCAIYRDGVENELWCKPLNELHPITLTEERLIEFGFKIWGHPSRRMAGLELTEFMSFEIDLINNNFHIVYCDNKIEGENACIEVNIKYSHQLQNLYFLLKGEEIINKNKPQDK